MKHLKQEREHYTFLKIARAVSDSPSPLVGDSSMLLQNAVPSQGKSNATTTDPSALSKLPNDKAQPVVQPPKTEGVAAPTPTPTASPISPAPSEVPALAAVNTGVASKDSQSSIPPSAAAISNSVGATSTVFLDAPPQSTPSVKLLNNKENNLNQDKASQSPSSLQSSSQPFADLNRGRNDNQPGRSENLTEDGDPQIPDKTTRSIALVCMVLTIFAIVALFLIPKIRRQLRKKMCSKYEKESEESESENQYEVYFQQSASSQESVRWKAERMRELCQSHHNRGLLNGSTHPSPTMVYQRTAHLAPNTYPLVDPNLQQVSPYIFDQPAPLSPQGILAQCALHYPDAVLYPVDNEGKLIMPNYDHSTEGVPVVGSTRSATPTTFESNIPLQIPSYERKLNQSGFSSSLARRQSILPEMLFKHHNNESHTVLSDAKEEVPATRSIIYEKPSCRNTLDMFNFSNAIFNEKGAKSCSSTLFPAGPRTSSVYSEQAVQNAIKAMTVNKKNDTSPGLAREK